MRKLIAGALLAALMAMPVAAAPIDVDHGPSITSRVLEIVTGWLAKIDMGLDPNGAKRGAGFDPIGAKSDDDSDRDGNGFPPFDGLGADWDPNG